MAKVTNIPDEHHIVRHCKNKLIIRKDGKIEGVHPEAFDLRPATATRARETYLSALYFEHFSADHLARMKACCEALPLVPKNRDGLMRLQVKSIKEQCMKKMVAIRVTHEPKKHCTGYAAIRGLPLDNDRELAELLATVALLEIVEVITVRASAGENST
jgi:hypothetical protein